MRIKKLEKEQIKLAKKIITKDSFEKIKTIAGIDQAFLNDKIISAIVVLNYPTLKIVGKAYSKIQTKFPYIPGYLSYREAPAIISAYKKLKIKPDILMIDGNGILHPRRIGLASHVGVLLKKPTIGVAKRLLCGKVRKCSGRACSALKSSKLDHYNCVYIDNELRGIALLTKKNCRPIYVSPGHLISLKSCVKIIKGCLLGYKLPEPLRLAHNYANEIKITNRH